MAKGTADISLTIIEDIKTTVTEEKSPSLYLRNPYTSEVMNKYHNRCLPLYIAAMQGDWEAANRIIQADPTVVRARITEGGETVLHIATTGKHIHFVKKLVAKMNPSDLGITNSKGNTALCFAALDGTVVVAEVMIAAAGGLSLPDICGHGGVKPLYIAALSGKRDMVNYLYGQTNVGDWNESEQVNLLITCITSSLLDTALNLTRAYPKLTVAKDGNGETALHVLARSPSIFASKNQDGLSRRFIKSHGENSMQTQALELLNCLLQNLFSSYDLNISEIMEEAPGMLFAAAYSGNTEFLIRFLQSFPDLIWKSNKENQTIFHVAVKNRNERILNLLHEIGSAGKVIATQRDKNDNNLLHLAANLAPPSNITGAALKMQYEIMWFKKVEKIVQQPLYREMRNSDGKTPQDLFIENHKELMKEAKQWMNEIAKSSTILATLIGVVVFLAAFIVLGAGTSSGSGGAPIFLKKKQLFGVLSISESIALSFSTISTLLFLSIISSRNTKIDFLRSLLLRLVLGMMTLLVSMAAMMVAFSTTFLLLYHHGLVWINVTLSLFTPVLVVYVLLKCTFCLDIVSASY